MEVVPGRRVRRPEPKRRSGGFGCLLQFLLAAVCAVALGYLFGSYLFQQTTTPTPSAPEQGRQEAPAPAAPGTHPNQGEDSKGSVSLPELALFQIQVGAFSQKANAERLAGELKAQGWAVELVPAGNLTQVRAGCYFGRERAEALQARLTREQVKPVVVTKVLAAKNLTFGAEEREYHEFLREAAATLAEALLKAEEGQAAVAAQEIKELLAAAQKLSASQAKAKAQLTPFLERVAQELEKAANLSSEKREQAVSRVLVDFAHWYNSL